MAMNAGPVVTGRNITSGAGANPSTAVGIWVLGSVAALLILRRSFKS